MSTREVEQKATTMSPNLRRESVIGARAAGRLTNVHGVIETAVHGGGNAGGLKGISPRELRELEAQIILGNNHQLFVRPGMEVIRHFGGLHRFIN